MEILISLIVSLVIFGLIIWAVQMLPLPPMVKQIVYVLSVLVLTLFLLGFIGWGPVHLYRR